MIKVKVEGLRETEQAILGLKKAVARRVIREAFLDAAEPMRADAEARAPRFKGFLARSIGLGTRLSNAQRAQHRKESDYELFMGPGPDPAAVQQEFGNRDQPPQPFMRPAFEAGKQPFLDRIVGAMRKAIEAQAAREARRLQRLARRRRR